LAYKDAHKDEKHVLMFEYDSGTFPPSQIGFSGNDSLRRYIKWAEPLLNIIDSIKVTNNAWGVDISPMIKLGIPAMSLNTDDKGQYFWYHHSEKDTPDHVDPLYLNKCVAAIALAVYIYADLLVDLPSQPIGVNNQTK
jgi:carboxypeptidase Q